jgi:predicted RNA-binding protein
MVNYWITVLPKDIVKRCIKNHYIQSTNGKAVSIERLKKGDRVIFYSPRETEMGDKCQAFTAIGTVAADEIYQAQVSSTNQPFCRDFIFEKCREVKIIPEIQKLSFIRAKSRWGEMFRLDLLLIPEEDFLYIASLMQQEKMMEM